MHAHNFLYVLHVTICVAHYLFLSAAFFCTFCLSVRLGWVVFFWFDVLVGWDGLLLALGACVVVMYWADLPMRAIV